MGLKLEPNHIFYTAFICSILLCFTPSPTMVMADDDETPTAYEILEEYEFPVGLIPKGVIAYELDRSTGKFSASLSGSCSFSLIGSYQLKYQSTITGYISKRKLTKLRGVSVKVLLFWVDIIEVVRSDEELKFSVGIASASYQVDNFEESPQCGCGFECDDGQARSAVANLNVSSS